MVPAPRLGHVLGRVPPGGGSESIVTWSVVRALAYIASAVVAVVFVDGGEVGAWICLAAAGLQPLLTPVARRVDHRVAEGAFDALAATAIAVAVPDLRFTALILLVAWAALLAATVRPELHLVIVGLLVVGVLAMGTSLGAFAWITTVVVGVSVLAVSLRGSIGVQRNQQRTEAILAEAMSAARAIIHTIDVETREVVELEGDVLDVTGWTREEWLAATATDLLVADDLAAFDAALANLDRVPEVDIVVRTLDGHGDRRWLRYSARVDIDRRGRQVLRGMLADVSAIHRIADELHEQARRDRVTGLPNRQRLEEDLDQHAVHGQPFVLMVADIRQFKAINDTLGHHIGDLILSMTGSRLSQMAQRQWSVYRLSADQFAVVVTGTSDPDRASVIAHQIAQEFRRPHHVGRIALGAPVTVGVALSAVNVAPSVTMRQADVALNAAKHARALVELYHADMQRFTLENLVLSAAVEEGLDRGEFVLHFQPQVDLQSGAVVGAEGLVRWHHRERGLLFPGDFLETVRLSASFERFTLAMVRQVVGAAARAADAPGSLGFAVNIELRSLLAQGFTDQLLALRVGQSIGQHRVVLEVTESEIADGLTGQSTTDLRAELDRLREGGFEIAIDDFGTGSSTLFRLDRMPVDELKIDRAFVQAVGTGQRSEMLLSSIIQLGRNLGLRVVAEGVELGDQLTYLAEAGCPVGQGWLFSKAVPVDELLDGLHLRHPVPCRDVPTVRQLRRVAPGN